MGNCLRRQSDWEGEDWEPAPRDDHSTRRRRWYRSADADPYAPVCVEREKLLGENISDYDSNRKTGFSSSSSSFSPSKREVKIKISRKELEELLAGVNGISVEQVLARLVGGGDDHGDYMHRQRSWRPALQSIPEIN